MPIPECFICPMSQTPMEDSFGRSCWDFLLVDPVLFCVYRWRFGPDTVYRAMVSSCLSSFVLEECLAGC